MEPRHITEEDLMALIEKMQAAYPIVVNLENNLYKAIEKKAGIHRTDYISVEAKDDNTYRFSISESPDFNDIPPGGAMHDLASKYFAAKGMRIELETTKGITSSNQLVGKKLAGITSAVESFFEKYLERRDVLEKRHGLTTAARKLLDNLYNYIAEKFNWPKLSLSKDSRGKKFVKAFQPLADDVADSYLVTIGHFKKKPANPTASSEDDKPAPTKTPGSRQKRD